MLSMCCVSTVSDWRRQLLKYPIIMFTLHQCLDTYLSISLVSSRLKMRLEVTKTSSHSEGPTVPVVYS